MISNCERAVDELRDAVSRRRADLDRAEQLLLQRARTVVETGAQR